MYNLMLILLNGLWKKHIAICQQFGLNILAWWYAIQIHNLFRVKFTSYHKKYALHIKNSHAIGNTQ
jgi:hypothetical protein